MNRLMIKKWVFTFVILIILPVFVFMNEEKDSVKSDNENRILSGRPVLQFENLHIYPVEYEEYYNDHLPFRDRLIKTNSIINYYVFKRSSSDAVMLGKDGWLFYVGEGKRTISDYYGDTLFSEKQLAEIADNLTDAEQKLKEMGKEFVLFIAPNKESIYGELYFPDYIGERGTNSKAKQLYKYLKENTEIKVVYPEDEIKREMIEHPQYIYYYKLDSHWNDLGGYIGAKAMVRELGIQWPEIEQLEVKQNTKGRRDLAKMLNIRDIIGDDENYYVEGYLTEEFKDWETETTFYYESEWEYADSRKILVLRDSYAGAMKDYIGVYFTESVMPHRESYTQDILFEENPDIVVYQTVERALDYLLGYKIIE